MFKPIFAVFFIYLLCLCSESDAGKSTRYWDCCKPSCAWPKKAAYRTHGPNTCKKDGHTIENNINAKNGCENGGTAYMCSNQQPWAINDQLAYGFAAAHLKNQKESNWCCGCYELTFTSGPVNGKKLVVQVTNTGSDLGDDHFDLQIPGGGVGIFGLGCHTQYNAGNDGWGQRYGGVANEGQCSQLPGELRSGCRWRFQWFKGADNPSHNYKRVKCPKQLTDKTGCIRSDEHFF